MANYIPSGDKRELNAEEMRARMLATGYNYIPTGGLPIEAPAKPSPIMTAMVIQKPVIQVPQKPGVKK